MISEKIKLWDNEDVTLTSYILDDSAEISLRKRPAMIICPGGWYLRTSDREAEPIAMKFASEGYNTFVLRYTTYYNMSDLDSNNQPKINKNSAYPKPLFDLAKAILTVRKNAEKYSIDTDKVFVCGFSAGGHLAASLGIHWDDNMLKEKFNVESELFKPNGMILGYPVTDYILMKELMEEATDEHLKESWELSGKSFFGKDNPSEEDFKSASPAYNVSSKTPPTFIWHTANDKTVDVRNSLNFASALSKYKIPYELHIFEDGVHGLSLCNEVTAREGKHINRECSIWINMAISWIKKYAIDINLQ